MSKYLFLTLSIFFATMGHAHTDLFTKSYVCPNSATTTSGITCCEDELSNGQCSSLTKELSEYTLDKIFRMKSKILNGDYPYKSNPNCHWNALSEFYEDIASSDLPFTDLMRYQELLERDFNEVATPQKGDLVVFYETNIFEKVLIEKNGRPYKKFIKTDGETIVHSAVYVKDGFVIQKENLDSSIFSMASIKKTADTFHSLLNENPSVKRSDIKFRIFRIKPQQ